MTAAQTKLDGQQVAELDFPTLADWPRRSAG
jgi:hypothetical protein